jgi:hypothetical protein
LNKKIRKINPNIVNGYSRRNISSLHPELQKEVDKLQNKKTQNDKDIDIINKFNGPDADTQILYYKKPHISAHLPVGFCVSVIPVFSS